MASQRKTHCKRGHPFNEKNTVWKISGRYRIRQCKRCNAERSQRKYYADPKHRELIIARAKLRYYEKKVFKATSCDPK